MKKPRMLILLIINCISTLLFCVIATVAWFAVIKNNRSTGMNVVIKELEITESNCYIYPVSDITNTYYTYAPDAELDHLELPTYDTSDILVFKYKKALVLDFEFVISALETPHQFELTLDCSDDCFGRAEEDRSLSNILSFYSATKTQDYIVNVTGNEQTFVTQEIINTIGTDESCPKSTHLSLTTFTIQPNTSAQTYHIYYITKYNQRAISYYTMTNVLNFDFTDDLTFKVELCEN